MKRNSILMTTIMAMGISLGGCAHHPGMSYNEYNQKIVMCEQLDMNVTVIHGVKNNVPYVREVVCKDQKGASWNAQQLSQ
ncbi:hypothetical protein PBI_SCTP2_79 [Salicola phage SCTP-2]|nr:hypothetical protein PBI_SCTP2_79 [Salicola phage SCTP-2]